MFKLLMILNIFGLIITGTESKETATRSCLEVPHLNPRSYYAPLQFFHLVLKCAKHLTETIVYQDQPFKQCIWLENLKYCSNIFKENENVDCSEEIKKLILHLIDEQTNNYQKEWPPSCFMQFVN